MVFIVDWTWSIMKRMDKLSREELKTIENDISAARRTGVEVKHSKNEIFVMGIKRNGRWYDATLVEPQFILAQKRLNRMRREGIDYDTTEDDLSIIAVDLSFIDLLCMCRFDVYDATEDELVPPPPPMPEVEVQVTCESEFDIPPPPPPMPECRVEEAKKRRRRGGRRHRGHRRA